MAGEGTPSDCGLGNTAEGGRTIPIDFIPLEIIVVDEEARIVGWNKAKQDSGSRLPNVGDVMYVDYASRHGIDMHAELMRCMETGKTKFFPDMPYRDEILSITISPFPGGALTIRENITERKLLAEEMERRRRMEAVATLAGAFAHDFNNVLTAPVGYAQLLERTSLDEAQRGFVGVIRDSMKKASSLASRIRRLSTSGMSKKRSIGLAEAADKAFREVGGYAGGMNVNVENLINPGVNVLADMVDVHHILTELAKNSVDATASSISISTEPYTAVKEDPAGLAEGEYFHITFADNGTGMDKVAKARAFDPLFTTREKKEGEKGKGLGLSMVYNIVVRESNGNVRIESEPGKGTAVHIYLPKAGRPERDTSAEISIPTEVRGGNETVLVVDDEDNLRKLVGQELGDLGYTVLEAEDGAKGLEVYNAHRDSIGLVLLDLVMPKMSGYEVLERILEKDPDAKVVICSARGEDPEREALLARAKAIVRKPYLPLEILTGTVREVLDS